MILGEKMTIGIKNSVVNVYAIYTYLSTLVLDWELRELSNSFSLSSDWLFTTVSSSLPSTSLRAFLNTKIRITTKLVIYTLIISLCHNRREVPLSMVNRISACLQPKPSHLPHSISCPFFLLHLQSLSVLASTNPHWNVSKSLPAYPDPITSSSYLPSLFFTTKLPQRVVPSFSSMPCNFASTATPLKLLSTRSTSTHLFLNQMSFFQSLPSLISLSDINDHALLSFKILICSSF